MTDLPDADELELPEGPALWNCKNGGCAAMKPRTTVTETARKTVYRCPLCSRALHIDWHDGGDE